MKNLETAIKAETNISTMEVLKPVENLQTIKLAFEEIKKIKDMLLDSNDIVKIKGKNYINKRGYRKLAIAFSISTEIVKEVRIVEGEITMYDFTVKAITPIWRYTEASASCSSEERDFNHLNNDVRATAQTRATNRSISDLIWLGEVSYEEISSKHEVKKDYNSNTIKNTSSESDDDMITQKQKRFLIRLVEAKYQDEESRNSLYKKIDTLTKTEARDTIKWLIDEWVEV